MDVTASGFYPTDTGIRMRSAGTHRRLRTRSEDDNHKYSIPIGVNHQGKRHRDALDTRDAGTGVIKGIAFGGPLGGLIGMVALTLAIPTLGPGALLAGIIIGLVAGIVLGAFGGLYRQVRGQEDAGSRTAGSPMESQPLQRCSAD